MTKTINKTAETAAVALFTQIEACLLGDDAPSAALRSMAGTAGFDMYPFFMLRKLEDTPQSPIHHPEGNVWNHTLRVVDEAAKRKTQSSDPRAFMWAALLHDIGKPPTTRMRKGRITAYDHDQVGSQMAREFLSAFGEDLRFIDKVAHLVKYHMQLLYVVGDLPFKDVGGMKQNADIHEVALLCLCDRLGRKDASLRAEEEQVGMFVDLCELE